MMHNLLFGGNLMIKEMHKAYCHQHQASKTAISFDYILINVFSSIHTPFS